VTGSGQIKIIIQLKEDHHEKQKYFGGFIFVILFAIALFGAYATYIPDDKTVSVAIGIGGFSWLY
jgi:hypothetical protein